MDDVVPRSLGCDLLFWAARPSLSGLGWVATKLGLWYLHNERATILTSLSRGDLEQGS